jgi:hypothetical protein
MHCCPIQPTSQRLIKNIQLRLTLGDPFAN